MKVIHKCPTCRFYADGNCKRNPPTVHIWIKEDPNGGWPAVHTETRWPFVSHFDWCGEYKHDKVKFAKQVLK